MGIDLTLSEIVTEFIRSTRERRGWTQRDLSKKSGVAQSTISYLEGGGRTYRGEHLEKIIKALGVGNGQTVCALLCSVARDMEISAERRAEAERSRGAVDAALSATTEPLVERGHGASDHRTK